LVSERGSRSISFLLLVGLQEKKREKKERKKEREKAMVRVFESKIQI
jgi:hypothetical protein